MSLMCSEMSLRRHAGASAPPELLAAFDAVEQETVPTAAAVWGVSAFGEAEFGDGNGMFQPMMASLAQKNGSKKNNVQDVLLAVTAYAHGLTLVSEDVDLRAVMIEHGGAPISFDEFMAR